MEVKKEDRRVRRTKKLMTQALIHLMQRKPLNEITVRELADECDINRGTFYMYYKDIYDMLDKVETEAFETLEGIIAEQKPNIEARASLPILKALCTYAEENREMWETLLSKHGDIAFLERVYNLVEEKCRAEWMKLHRHASESEFELGYAYAAFGCVGLIRGWLQSENPEPAEKIASIADLLLHKGVLSPEVLQA